MFLRLIKQGANFTWTEKKSEQREWVILFQILSLSFWMQCFEWSRILRSMLLSITFNESTSWSDLFSKPQIDLLNLEISKIYETTVLYQFNTADSNGMVQCVRSSLMGILNEKPKHVKTKIYVEKGYYVASQFFIFNCLVFSV